MDSLPSTPIPGGSGGSGESMEQARDWMWAKRKHCLRSCGDYWEEQAFVEDSAGSLGGCTWPPRSYSCSFCRREFRSAQALGGHMNVHRRDKARLNQPPTLPQTEILPHQISIPPSASLYDPNSNTNTNHNAAVIIASSLSPSRVSTPSNTRGNYCEQSWVSPSYSSSSSIILHQHLQQHTKGSIFSPPPSWSDSVAVRVVTVSDSKKIEGEKNWRVDEDVGVDWNLVVPRNQPAGSGGGGGGEEAAFISKRRRSDDISSPLLNFLNSVSVDRHHLQSEVLGFCTNPEEDLDLELRLGDGPKVK